MSRQKPHGLQCRSSATIVALACLSLTACAPATQQRAEPATSLINPRVPRAKAGDLGWRYQQRVSSDLDGDGTNETAVLICDVILDANSQPMWEDGHRWQVYVEEPSGERTHVYARFLPNGKLTAELGRADSTSLPTIVLLEQTPYKIGVYEIAYNGPNRLRVWTRLERDVRPTEWFLGSSRP